MPAPQGKPTGRRHLITVQRKTVTIDAYGGEVETWNFYTREYAQISYGTGAEQRNAAQEGASLPATFRFAWTPDLAAAQPLDRLLFSASGEVADQVWDITAVNPLGFNQGVSITATRAA